MYCCFSFFSFDCLLTILTNLIVIFYNFLTVLLFIAIDFYILKITLILYDIYFDIIVLMSDRNNANPYKTPTNTLTILTAVFFSPKFVK